MIKRNQPLIHIFRVDNHIEEFVKLFKVIVDVLPIAQLTRDLYDTMIIKLLTWTRSTGGNEDIENDSGDDGTGDDKKDEKSKPKERSVNEEKPSAPPMDAVSTEAGNEKPPLPDDGNPTGGNPQQGGSRYINPTLENALANIVVALTDNLSLRIWYDVDSWFVHSGLKVIMLFLVTFYFCKGVGVATEMLQRKDREKMVLLKLLNRNTLITPYENNL